MDDKEIVGRISRAGRRGAAPRGGARRRGAERRRAAAQAELEVTLDQMWDLLRQRRAKRNAGQDPDAAQERSPDAVEGYLQ